MLLRIIIACLKYNILHGLGVGAGVVVALVWVVVLVLGGGGGVGGVGFGWWLWRWFLVGVFGRCKGRGWVWCCV